MPIDQIATNEKHKQIREQWLPKSLSGDRGATNQLVSYLTEIEHRANASLTERRFSNEIRDYLQKNTANPSAAYIMGLYCESTWGKEGRVAALTWYQMAANQSHEDALHKCANQDVSTPIDALCARAVQGDTSSREAVIRELSKLNIDEKAFDAIITQRAETSYRNLQRELNLVSKEEAQNIATPPPLELDYHQPKDGLTWEHILQLNFNHLLDRLDDNFLIDDPDNNHRPTNEQGTTELSTSVNAMLNSDLTVLFSPPKQTSPKDKNQPQFCVML